MKTAILIDSGCDVIRRADSKYHYEVMPLHIIYPEKDYVDGLIFFGNDLSRFFKGDPPTSAKSTGR